MLATACKTFHHTPQTLSPFARRGDAPHARPARGPGLTCLALRAPLSVPRPPSARRLFPLVWAGLGFRSNRRAAPARCGDAPPAASAASAVPPPPCRPRRPAAPRRRPRLSGCSAAVFRTPAFRSGPDAPAVPFRARPLRPGESRPLFAPRAAFWPIPRTAGGVLQGRHRAFGRGGRKSGKKGASPSSPEKGDAGRRPERGSEKTAAAGPRRAGQAAGRRGRAPARVSPPSTRPSKRPASASSTSGTMERNSPRPTAVLR